MRFWLRALLVITAGSWPLLASGQGISIAARAGTLGPGAEVVTSLDPHFNVRMGANYLAYSRQDYITDFDVAVDVTSDLRLTSFSLIADVLPFERILRMSLGLVYNHNQISSVAVAAEPYTIEGKTFSAERIGTLEGSMTHRRPFQPYMGLGLGNPLRGRATLLLDVGMLYTDAPQLQMQGTGMIAPTAEQAPDLEAAMYSFRWYPVAAVGFGLRF